MLALAGCDIQQPQADKATAGSETAQRPRWSTQAAGQLRQAIGRRAAHGLDQMPFALAGEGDAELTRVALAYASALARGATDPAKLYDLYTVPRPAPDLKAGLADALRTGNVTAWLDSLAPRTDEYRRLSQAYLKLAAQPMSPPANVPAAGEMIRPGMSDPRMPIIAQQLVNLDYIDVRAAQGTRYTPAMVAAVKRMQADYGMKPDGVIGSEALAILNMSDLDRRRAIAVAMERMRWLERTPPPTRIDVNVAAARLTYWRDGRIADRRNVVVGEPDKQTPQLGSPIFRLVANPTWTVPRSVQNNEIAQKGPGYLEANDMEWKDGWIVQRSGPKNSLGLVKFDMQNDQAIYLHDTPAKALFGMVQRQRSHGCVRVEDALGFAAMLARDEGVEEEWNEAQASGEESFVKLPRRIPVRMLYQTVLFDQSGEPIVRNDPYGWDDRVGAALGFKAGRALRVRSGGGDIAP
ncbi:L,D-transpeptidase family protein [Sphingomonas quercus]|uniref:L,D-transpeptidase family protein n=1 Tax=Sphingomonas quercus TaxID=2842451 RepID=A0ABS6BKD4_9SPHN|nr:L,D-transpeptidase family protein [Sphingomonas quercus]MBU3078758.1 L,D-transpeptidase family protein [Sphingomonas quercus]